MKYSVVVFKDNPKNKDNPEKFYTNIHAQIHTHTPPHPPHTHTQTHTWVLEREKRIRHGVSHCSLFIQGH